MSRLFIVLFVVVVVATVPAAGQNGTATPTPGIDRQVSVQIDPLTTLTDWSFSNGTWHLTIRVKAPNRLVITDSAAAMQAWADADGKTVVDLNQRGYSLTSGTTKITYSGTVFDGQSAITISSPESSKFLATGGIQAGSRRIPMRTLQLAVLGTFLATGYGSYRITKEKMDDTDAMEAERII